MSLFQNDPTVFDTNNPHFGIYSKSNFLLKNAKVNGAGPWIDARLFKNFTVHVMTGLGSGTGVQIQASNEDQPDPSAGNANAVNVGSAINAAGITQVTTGPYRWVRAVVSTIGTGGSVTAILHGING